jgi:hypothetical protein
LIRNKEMHAMAGIRLAVAALILFASASQVQAFGRHASGMPGLASGPSRNPNPAYMDFGYACPPGYSLVAPARPATIYAVPFAAPPSTMQTVEPPTNRPVETGPPPLIPKMKNADLRDNPVGPTVVATRSLTGNAPPSNLALPAKDRCRVGFWNLTGRDVTLVVEGRSHSLARDRALTLDLNRSFTWQIDARGPQSEQVADDQATHEVVVR